MKINNLIGMSGHINSGKDLAGEMVIYIDSADKPTYEGFKSYIDIDSDFIVKKCADKLKDIVCITIGCTRKDLEDEVFKNTPLGEEWERYKLMTFYTPFPLDSSSNEFYEETLYFATEAEAKHELKYQIDINGSDYLEGQIKMEVLTPRKILQLFGTQGGRKQVHPNIWVNSLFTDWKPKYFRGCDPYALPEEILVNAIYPKWVITDVRFPNNEGVAVTKRGGLLIGIRRKFELKFPQHIGLANPKRGENEYSVPMALNSIDYELYNSLTHESEIAMGDHSWCDVVIENNGTIEDLFNNILEAIR